MIKKKPIRAKVGGGDNAPLRPHFAASLTLMINRTRSLSAALALVMMMACALPAQAFSLVRDAEIERLMRDYSNPLLRAAGLVPERVGIGLINDRNLNAFVTNGQNMYIHTGLILEADEPNMVIGVIAHEIGHITGGHLARGAEAMSKAHGPALVGTILGMASILAGAGDIGMALIAGSQQVAIRSFLTYSRGQEAAADNTALQLLEATGQSPEGIIGMMNDLASQEILAEVYQDPYARSHPMSRDRVRAYEQGAKGSPHLDAKDPQALVFRHKMAQAKIYGFLDSPNVTLRRVRQDNSQPGRYARAIAYYRQGRREEAIVLIDQLLSEMPGNPWLYELKGQVFYETGMAASGIAPYRRSVELMPEEPLLLIGLATCQLGVGQAGTKADKQINQQAVVNLRRALRLDPSNATAYFQMAKGYGQLGQTALAQWALAEYHAALKSPEAKMHARRAMKGLPKGSVEYIRAVDIISGPSAKRRR